MYFIAEASMLIRAQIELPAWLKLKTHGFRKGWNFVESENARLMERHALSQGWKFIRVVDGWMRSGVGETSQAAIGNALRLALRMVGSHFNAVDVGYIEWTKYPRFYLASVMINPYRIQNGAMIPVLDEVASPTTNFRTQLLPIDAALLFPNFTNAIPALKEMLELSRGSQTRSQ
jgi:hypothetical protein